MALQYYVYLLFCSQMENSSMYLVIRNEYISLGAHVNCRTTEGMTPLHFATYGGHVECVRILLKAKADVHATTRFEK